mgnify:CR=1 FL=1
MNGKVGGWEHQKYIADKSRNTLIPRPIQIKDDDGKVVYDNSDIFKPQPFFILRKSPYECPYCHADIGRAISRDTLRKTVSVYCSSCKEYITEDQIQKIMKKVEKLQVQTKKKTISK